jgi:hypothetical protein
VEKIQEMPKVKTIKNHCGSDFGKFSVPFPAPITVPAPVQDTEKI